MNMLDAEGWLTGPRRVPSPNCDERPAGQLIRLIVVHAISLPPGEFGGDGIERLFTNTLDPAAHPYYREILSLRVSAHFLIRRAGDVVQFVPCHLRAWHAGASSWRGAEGCNDFSIGIELEGSDDLSFGPPQYATLARLVHNLRQHYPIEDIVGHSDIAPGRKTDPGPQFDWMQFHRLLAISEA
ncbi:MAG: 1,6-anhydro-N-acetylmuramyl-L-alanine amidase AmpD [Betaproteobacteria bacterium]|jgi:AmpD protein|nr:1,6-anhydro-N-acetylmuramyl-L-alanine amidase AmpD [Betaproteobacteria bacterium]